MKRWMRSLIYLVVTVPGLLLAKSTMPLDQIVYQVQADNWVSTSSADVSITIDATLDKSGLSQMRQEMMNNCKKIADVEWHVTSFNRFQDPSGLEKINATVQGRVPEDKLSAVREQAKAVSRPGATYQISGIDFQPTLAEVQKVKANLREDLYQKINEEVARLNKLFPQQQYSVHQVDFLGALKLDQPQAVNRAKVMSMEVSQASLVVSNKLTLTATVVIAANRSQAKV